MSTKSYRPLFIVTTIQYYYYYYTTKLYYYRFYERNDDADAAKEEAEVYITMLCNEVSIYVCFICRPANVLGLYSTTLFSVSMFVDCLTHSQVRFLGQNSTLYMYQSIMDSVSC